MAQAEQQWIIGYAVAAVVCSYIGIFTSIKTYSYRLRYIDWFRFLIELSGGVALGSAGIFPAYVLALCALQLHDSGATGTSAGNLELKFGLDDAWVVGTWAVATVGSILCLYTVGWSLVRRACGACMLTGVGVVLQFMISRAYGVISDVGYASSTVDTVLAALSWGIAVFGFCFVTVLPRVRQLWLQLLLAAVVTAGVCTSAFLAVRSASYTPLANPDPNTRLTRLDVAIMTCCFALAWSLISGSALMWLVTSQRSRKMEVLSSLILAVLLVDKRKRILLTPTGGLPLVVLGDTYLGNKAFTSYNKDFVRMVVASMHWDVASVEHVSNKGYSDRLYSRFLNGMKFLASVVGLERHEMGIMYPQPIALNHESGGYMCLCVKVLENSDDIVSHPSAGLVWARLAWVRERVYRNFDFTTAHDTADEAVAERSNSLAAALLRASTFVRQATVTRMAPSVAPATWIDDAVQFYRGCVASTSHALLSTIDDVQSELGDDVPKVLPHATGSVPVHTRAHKALPHPSKTDPTASPRRSSVVMVNDQVLTPAMLHGTDNTAIDNISRSSDNAGGSKAVEEKGGVRQSAELAPLHIPGRVDAGHLDAAGNDADNTGQLDAPLRSTSLSSHFSDRGAYDSLSGLFLATFVCNVSAEGIQILLNNRCLHTLPMMKIKDTAKFSDEEMGWLTELTDLYPDQDLTDEEFQDECLEQSEDNDRLHTFKEQFFSAVIEMNVHLNHWAVFVPKNLGKIRVVVLGPRDGRGGEMKPGRCNVILFVHVSMKPVDKETYDRDKFMWLKWKLVETLHLRHHGIAKHAVLYKDGRRITPGMEMLGDSPHLQAGRGAQVISPEQARARRSLTVSVLPPSSLSGSSSKAIPQALATALKWRESTPTDAVEEELDVAAHDNWVNRVLQTCVTNRISHKALLGAAKAVDRHFDTMTGHIHSRRLGATPDRKNSRSLNPFAGARSIGSRGARGSTSRNLRSMLRRSGRTRVIDIAEDAAEEAEHTPKIEVPDQVYTSQKGRRASYLRWLLGQPQEFTLAQFHGPRLQSGSGSVAPALQSSSVRHHKKALRRRSSENRLGLAMRPRRSLTFTPAGLGNLPSRRLLPLSPKHKHTVSVLEQAIAVNEKAAKGAADDTTGADVGAGTADDSQGGRTEQACSQQQKGVEEEHGGGGAGQATPTRSTATTVPPATGTDNERKTVRPRATLHRSFSDVSRVRKSRYHQPGSPWRRGATGHATGGSAKKLLSVQFTAPEQPYVRSVERSADHERVARSAHLPTSPNPRTPRSPLHPAPPKSRRAVSMEERLFGHITKKRQSPRGKEIQKSAKVRRESTPASRAVAHLARTAQVRPTANTALSSSPLRPSPPASKGTPLPPLPPLPSRGRAMSLAVHPASRTAALRAQALSSAVSSDPALATGRTLTVRPRGSTDEDVGTLLLGNPKRIRSPVSPFSLEMAAT